MTKRRLLITVTGLLALAACSPSLDWREVRADEAELLALFPCKPERVKRGAEGLLVCKAAGSSFSLSWSELDDPAQVTPALRAMREALARKLMAAPAALQPLALPGMTPNAEAGRVSLVGQGVDGVAQHAEVLVFTRGRRVHQLVMLGGKPNPQAWEMFAGGIKALPMPH